MACLIDAWRHIHLPSLHCIREIKNSPVLLSEQFVAGDEQHRLSLHGGHPHSPQHHLFSPCLPLLVLRLSPPSHRTALCSSGGRGGLCGDFCTAVRRCPAAGRFGRATRSFSLLIGNFHRPVSLEDVNTLSLSLYIFIISRSVHFIWTGLAKYEFRMRNLEVARHCL